MKARLAAAARLIAGLCLFATSAAIGVATYIGFVYGDPNIAAALSMQAVVLGGTAGYYGARLVRPRRRSRHIRRGPIATSLAELERLWHTPAGGPPHDRLPERTDYSL